MKAKFTLWYNALAATLLSLLGFSSCGENNGEPCLYGSPTSTFQVKGNVTDENGTPIQDIKAIFGEAQQYIVNGDAYHIKEEIYPIDSAYTTTAEFPRLFLHHHQNIRSIA